MQRKFLNISNVDCNNKSCLLIKIVVIAEIIINLSWLYSVQEGVMTTAIARLEHKVSSGEKQNKPKQPHNNNHIWALFLPACTFLSSSALDINQSWLWNIWLEPHLACLTTSATSWVPCCAGLWSRWSTLYSLSLVVTISQRGETRHQTNAFDAQKVSAQHLSSAFWAVSLQDQSILGQYQHPFGSLTVKILFLLKTFVQL